MRQLIILLPADLDLTAFDQGWPAFLEAAEQMPGLVKETITRIDRVLFGEGSFQRMYTFSFQDQDALEKALLSSWGEKAGRIIHDLGGAKLTILTGESQSDTLDRIQSFSKTENDS